MKMKMAKMQLKAMELAQKVFYHNVIMRSHEG